MIYLLKRKGDWDYDEYDAKCIRATSEKKAREIANTTTGDEGKIWTDRSKVTCEIVDAEGPDEELLASFNAG